MRLSTSSPFALLANLIFSTSLRSGTRYVIAVAGGAGASAFAAEAFTSQIDKEQQTRSALNFMDAIDVPEQEPVGQADAIIPQPSRETQSVNKDKYHLLWSPGALKKIFTGMVTLFILHSSKRFLDNTVIGSFTGPLSPRSHNAFSYMATNVLVPMLASACCLLQLALNLVSVGCAGFNTFLGPVRPYFISLLLYMTAISSFHSISLSGTALRWAVALMPEAVHIWNNRGRSLASHYQAVNIHQRHAVVYLNIPSMGCVSCINKIDSTLKKMKHVLSSNSWLNESGGQAQVQITANSQEEMDSTAASLTMAIQAAGFPDSAVVSVEMKPSPH